MKSITRTQVFRGAVAVIALHIADDTSSSPSRHSPGDHLVSGLVPLALLALAVWGFRGSAAAARARSPSSSAPLGLATGLEAIHYAARGAVGRRLHRAS